ncbi:MAG: NUDIX domain-containing protein [Acidimicrobiales bacterium]
MAISPHIARLRTLVGSELLQLPSVVVLPVDSSGNVLLARHADTGVWGLVGGAIEIDESPCDAAMRETVEEIGLRPTAMVMIGAFGGPEYRVQYPNGDLVSYVVTAYEARLETGNLMPDGEEVTEARWFGGSTLPMGEMNNLAAALLRDAGYD